MNKRVLFCGGRDYTDRATIKAWLSKVQKQGYDTLIEGEARGADTIAREEAEKMGFTVLKFPADWTKYHRAAGPIRNRQMLIEGKPELVVAFHDVLSNSKGTKNMVETARRARVETIVISQGSEELDVR
jgi:YspA, cpYpsA-related SLOG family